MKKLFLNKFYFCLSSLALITGVHGQSNNSAEPVSVTSASLTLNSLHSTSAAKLTSNKFSANAIRNFAKDFKEVAEPSWGESYQGYTASFSKNGIQSRIIYDRRGEWVSTIRYYGKDNLPSDIRQIIESDFGDYSIFIVTEVAVEDNVAYFVTLEDSKYFIRVKVLNGEMTVLEKTNKAN